MKGNLTVQEFEEAVLDGSLHANTHNATLIGRLARENFHVPLWSNGWASNASTDAHNYPPGTNLRVHVEKRTGLHGGPVPVAPDMGKPKPRVLLFDELTARDRLAWDLFVQFSRDNKTLFEEPAMKAFTAADTFFKVRKTRKEPGA